MPVTISAQKNVDKVQLLLPGLVPKTPGNTAPLSTHLARTPLFSLRRRGKRTLVDDFPLASPQVTEMYYSGHELDMGDQDVYLVALHLAANHKPNSAVNINRADFLTKIGRKSKGMLMYDWLEKSFFRLAKGSILIITPKMKISMPLLGKLVFYKETGQYALSIPEDTMDIFLEELYGYINLDIRKAISKNVDLAKWVQGYTSSHSAGQHTVKIDSLRVWCGYSGPVYKFRNTLAEALEELQRVNFFQSWSYVNNNTSVKWYRERYYAKPRALPAELLHQANA
jgi:hypothetical protein